MQIDTMFKAYGDAMMYGSNLTLGMLKYMWDFMEPSLNTQKAFMEVEVQRSGMKGKENLEEESKDVDLSGLSGLMHFNNDLAFRSLQSGLHDMIEFQLRFQKEGLDAWQNTLFEAEGETEAENLADFYLRKSRAVDMVVNQLPQAVVDIKSEYGFHFDNGGYVRADETDRFVLYQVLPYDKKVKTRRDGKPVLIIPPYVLGPNILAFLPGEKRSYVHSFADQGIPTYIRIVKDIHKHEAVQVMTGEDDARDSKRFCKLLKKKYGKAVTLNGFCQGGFIALCTLLTGELDDLVDALITCVTPMDGTLSPSFTEYMGKIPKSFQDLEYAMKTLPNGNRVIDGKIMSWVYRLKSIESENPLSSYCNALSQYDTPNGNAVKISKIAAAINHWLVYDRTDLPAAITRMSYQSYTTPIDKKGNLPVRLFGRKLNLKHIEEKNIHFLMAYAENDDLITLDTAMAPLDHISAEVTIYPKGHGGIATSWSVPTSECAHHTCFLGSSGRRKHRGVVRYHLDLEDGLIKPDQRRNGGDRRDDRAFIPFEEVKDGSDSSGS